jgi:biotin carboxyl carrier protein
MQGTVVKIAVSENQQVEQGDLIVVVEAMKMEHRITAPQDGVVSALFVALGDQVGNGQLMLTLAGDEKETSS